MAIPPPLKLHLWLTLTITVLVSLYLPTFTVSWNEFDLPIDHNPSLTTTYTYNRFPEIQHRCAGADGSSTLLSPSPPSPLSPDDDRGSRIRNELSFVSGDWVQEAGGSPLPPFHDPTSSGTTSLFKLASFQVTDVDSVRRSKDMVSLSGRLVLSLTNGPGFRYRSRDDSFGGSSMGSDSVSVHLEGVYFEVDGERVMCFLGNTSMPSSSSSSSMDQFDVDLAHGGCNCEEQNIQQPYVVQNDQIMLVLRYPKVLTFSSRGVYGEMISFGRESDGKYFDKVYISSQLSSPSKYQFSADEQLLSGVCSSNLNQGRIKLYEGGGFCHTLKDILNNEILDFAVLRSAGSRNNRSRNKLGPFALDSSSTMGTTTALGLLIHHVQCQEHGDGDMRTAEVAAVLRIVDSSDRFSTNRGRTGLSNMTLSAEGIWRSGDELCMVACVGSNTKQHEPFINRSCNSRVSLSIPLELSITQRRLMFASISSIDGDEESGFAPLLFEKVIHPRELSYRYYMKQSYKYSELVLKQARNLESKQTRSSLLDLGFSLLKYPSLSSNGAQLAEELTVNVGAVELEILSVGSFVRGEQTNHQSRHIAPSNEEEQEQEQDSMVEVSGLLKLKASYDISLSFEGTYSELTGHMHLVGCRDPRGLSNISSIEEQMDCEYEMRVEYPSTTTRWLINPKARISINSRRDSSDPFYSPSISLTTHPIPNTMEREDMMFRETFETTLRVLMLTSAVVLILRQLSYMARTATTTSIAASVSLVMLGIHAIGYGVPLLTSTEAMFRWKVVSPYPRTHVDPDFSIKLLLFFALLLTLKLSNKVKLSRGLSRDNGRALNRRDMIALLITSAILAAGFLFLHISLSLITNPTPSTQAFKPADDSYFPAEKTMDRSRSEATGTIYGLGVDYAGIAQDLFLVPQAIGYALRKLRVSSSSSSNRALTSSYYIGFTVLRVLIRVYECVRDPVLYGKEMGYEETTTMMEDYSGNLMINMIAAAGVIAVAVVVHLQQKGGEEKEVDRKGKAAVVAVDSSLEEELLSGRDGL